MLTSLIPSSYITSFQTSSQHFLRSMLYLLSNTNDPASRTTARVARSLALLMTALAQIISASMHDDRSAQYAFRPNQLDLLVRDGTLGVALAICFEVAEVANVAFTVGGGAVGFGERVDWEKRTMVSAKPSSINRGVGDYLQ